MTHTQRQAADAKFRRSFWVLGVWRLLQLRPREIAIIEATNS